VLLANLYRSLVRDHTFVTIGKEVSLCEMYVDIFSLRYDSKFYYEIDIEPQIQEYGIPKNLLQPLVENYFVYGIRSGFDNNRFIIQGWKKDDDIFFCFEDNGYGIPKDRLDEIKTRLSDLDHNGNAGYGLSNIHERIRLIYGDTYGISINSEENSYTQVFVHIKAVPCDELKKIMS